MPHSSSYFQGTAFASPSRRARFSAQAAGRNVRAALQCSLLKIPTGWSKAHIPVVEAVDHASSCARLCLLLSLLCFLIEQKNPVPQRKKERCSRFALNHWATVRGQSHPLRAVRSCSATEKTKRPSFSTPCTSAPSGKSPARNMSDNLFSTCRSRALRNGRAP